MANRNKGIPEYFKVVESNGSNDHKTVASGKQNESASSDTLLTSGTSSDRPITVQGEKTWRDLLRNIKRRLEEYEEFRSLGNDTGFKEPDVGTARKSSAVWIQR